MNRRHASLRSLAVAASSDTTTATSAAAMSFRPYVRGRRPQGSRGFSNRPLNSTNGEFVSGDSHFDAIRATNRGFRPGYHAVPPPSHYGTTGKEYYGPVSQPHRPVPPVSQHPPGPGPGRRPYRHPKKAGPAFGNHQQFSPQQMRPQFRPRQSKPPDYREWEYSKPGPPPHSELFTVLSYNILADYLATDHYQKLYFHIPRYVMDWNRRKRNLCFELGLWSPDILCFQEVDRFQDLEAELNPRGYTGIWKMRTGEPADGCAVFWRVSRFKLVQEESIEYNKLGLRDNVAQICVFESLSGLNSNNGESTPSTSSACSNRVVVCNIHVLFNPKRGDIKLGQIRLLLEKAHAISNRWDHAPIVICGDFNCTPKSPMYNFIKEQKLYLSELPRDKVSGQASAEIRPYTPSYPDYRKEALNDSISTSEVNDDKPEQGGFPLGTHGIVGMHSSTDSSSMANISKSECSVVDETSESCTDKECESRRLDDLPSHYMTESFTNENVSTQHVLVQPLHGSLTSHQNDTIPHIDPAGVPDGNALSGSSCIHTKATEVGECVESHTQSLSKAPDNHIKNLSLPDDQSNDFARTSLSTRAYSSDTSKLVETSENVPPHSLDIAFPEHVETASAATGNHEKSSIEPSSPESASDDFTLDEKFERLSINNSVDGAADELREDCETFLSELHNTDETIVDVRNSFSSASSWSPAEIQIATGTADCKVLEHPLKLKSAYAEVESSSGSRDASGEPLMTSYHRRFSGTVDYIWCSEGLQTKKVLAPIPKEVMQQTRGFPTKKWGSDHIALVAELAFTKDDTPSKKASQ